MPRSATGRGHRRGRRARLESPRRLRSSRGTGDRPRLERRRRRDRLAGHADAGDDAPQIRELGLTTGTRRQMRLERPDLGRIERVNGVRRDGLFEFLVRRVHVSAPLSVIIADRMRVLTVPSGTPVRAAISECVKPS